MPNINSVSDLRNYNEILQDITFVEPVLLTKNDIGRYVIVDIKEYERQRATLRLLSELAKTEKSEMEKGWLTEEEVEKVSCP